MRAPARLALLSLSLLPLAGCLFAEGPVLFDAEGAVLRADGSATRGIWHIGAEWYADPAKVLAARTSEDRRKLAPSSFPRRNQRESLVVGAAEDGTFSIHAESRMGLVLEHLFWASYWSSNPEGILIDVRGFETADADPDESRHAVFLVADGDEGPEVLRLEEWAGDAYRVTRVAAAQRRPSREDPARKVWFLPLVLR